MKKLLILTAERNENKEKLAGHLRNGLKGKAEVTLGIFSDLVVEIASGKVNVGILDTSMQSFDLVYIRSARGNTSLAKSVGLCLKLLGVSFMDPFWGKANYGGDKLTSQTKLAVNNLPVIPTFFCSKKYLFDNFGSFSKKYGLPLVAKELTSQRLEGVYLVRSKADIERLPSVKAKGQATGYLFQKFIDFDREYRLVVLGSRVAVVHTKVKRNFGKLKIGYEDEKSQAVFVKPASLSLEIRRVAVKSARTLGLKVAGVDACFEKSTGRIFLIEVNRGPGFEYDEAISTELPALSKFIEKELLASAT
jgi:glutathione synthase/RimK-type ligase-like ATP-grasp enzyme